MGAGKLTRKSDDPEDERRVDELNDLRMVTRGHKGNPGTKKLLNLELVFIDAGDTKRLGIRAGGKVYGIDLVELVEL